LGEISLFAFLADAQKAYHERQYDLVICDGTLQNYGDGLAWAKELFALGQLIIFCSCGDNDFPGTKMDKCCFDRQKLREIAQQMF